MTGDQVLKQTGKLRNIGDTVDGIFASFTPVRKPGARPELDRAQVGRSLEEKGQLLSAFSELVVMKHAEIPPSTTLCFMK
jgi:hypothetical protein